MKTILKTFVGLSLLLFLAGCANMVTDKTIKDDSTGNSIAATLREVEFTFSFADTPAVNSGYNYYLLISSVNINVITPAQTPEAYFFAPGEQFSQQRMINTYSVFYSGDPAKTLQSIYQYYFRTWDSYIVFNSDIFRQYNGPFSVSANYQPIQLGFSNLSPDRKKIKLKIPFPTGSDTIHFNFLAVDEQKRLIDRIAGDASVTFKNGYTSPPYSVDNVQAISVGGLDLVSYNVRTYQY